MNPQIIRGAYFAAALPPGFTQVPVNPMMLQQQIMMQQMQGIPAPYSNFLLTPPGSNFGPFTPAIVIVDELNPTMSQMLQMGLYNLESPDVAMGFAQALQAQYVFNCSAVREMQLAGGTALTREFDAVGYPPYNVAIHGLLMLMQGPFCTVKVMVAVHTQRWAEFLAPCLQFAGGINVTGGQPQLAPVIAVADPARPDQMQLNIVNPQTKQQFPTVMAPAGPVYNVMIIHTGANSTFVNGNINGAGIAVGEHSFANYTATGADTAEGAKP